MNSYSTRRTFLQQMAVLASGPVLAASGLSFLPQSAKAADTAGGLSWLAEIQQPPAKLPADAPKLAALTDANGAPFKTREAWQARRDALRGEWRALLGDLGVARAPLPKLEVLQEEMVDGVRRRLVKYDSEPGWPTEAYLLEPLAPAPAEGRPCAVVFHSTVDHSILQPAGLAGPPQKFFGWNLARRGFTCFCPRNFLWPDNMHIAANEQTKRFYALHPQATGMAKMLYDAQRAVDLVLAQPGVDAKRVCAIGHSLGAKEVLYLAAFDERVKVTVSSEGGIGTKFSNWDAGWYLGESVKRLGPVHEHHELLALVAPRPFLLLGGDSADGDRGWPFIEAALPIYRLYGDAPPLGQFNHKQGHSVPPVAEERIYQWITQYV